MAAGKNISKTMMELRKYIPTPEDAEIVREMLQDGLTPEQVLEALGHVGVKPENGGLPESHAHAHKMTQEQEEREAQAAGLGQPGEVVGGGSEAGEEGDGEDDMLTHVAGLLASVTKRKSNKLKNGVKSSPAR